LVSSYLDATPSSKPRIATNSLVTILQPSLSCELGAEGFTVSRKQLCHLRIGIGDGLVNQKLLAVLNHLVHLLFQGGAVGTHLTALFVCGQINLTDDFCGRNSARILSGSFNANHLNNTVNTVVAGTISVVGLD